MFSIHDRVSWIARTKGVMVDFILVPFESDQTITGTIVAEEENDHYLVKRDSDGKCETLCYRKLSKI